MNAFADVIARLDQHKEKLCPELREAIASEHIAQPDRLQTTSSFTDFFSKEGAEELVRRLKLVWPAAVKFRIVKETTAITANHPRVLYVVRSDLINGLPVRK